MGTRRIGLVGRAMAIGLVQDPATDQLRLHVRGALNNGVTAEEIREVLVHATVYCGIPAGLDAFEVAHGVLVADAAPPDPGAGRGQPADPKEEGDA